MILQQKRVSSPLGGKVIVNVSEAARAASETFTMTDILPLLLGGGHCPRQIDLVSQALKLFLCSPGMVQFRKGRVQGWAAP